MTTYENMGENHVIKRLLTPPVFVPTNCKYIWTRKVKCPGKSKVLKGGYTKCLCLLYSHDKTQ